jgi:hypothetical protein
MKHKPAGSKGCAPIASTLYELLYLDYNPMNERVVIVRISQALPGKALSGWDTFTIASMPLSHNVSALTKSKRLKTVN